MALLRRTPPRNYGVPHSSNAKNLSGFPRNLLITGGAGFIGSHLTEELLKRGDRVVVVDDFSTGRLDNLSAVIGDPCFDLVEGDVNNADTIDGLVRDADVVFHLAASVGVRRIMERSVESIENNVLGTHTVLASAVKHGPKVVLASTSEVYGKNAKVPFGEDDDRLLGPTTKARWSYAESKALDEFLALAHHAESGLPVVIARLFNTVGVRQSAQYGMVIPRFVEQALAGEPLTVYDDGQQSRCFCDVEDVVRALVALADSKAAEGTVVNVGSDHEVTILQLARMVLAETGADPDDDHCIRFVPYSEAYSDGFEDMRRRVPDISRIQQLIGWQPRVPLDETLCRVVASQRSGGDQ
jgi:UDP-glucose 4-epimerase